MSTMNEILKSLPHGSPAIYVDRIISFSSKENILIAEKDIKTTDYLLQGHFPENPVMPGIYSIESLAQSCIIYDYYSCYGGKFLEKNQKNYLLFKINIKFRNKVVPDDTIILQSSLKENYGQIQSFRVKAFRKSDNEIVTEGEITVLITENITTPI